MDGRIWFPGNPWPDGHRVEDFAWTGRLDEAGRLWFDLTLRSAFYDETGGSDEDEGAEPDDQSDWESPIGWNNYHRCTLSSSYWEDATGLLAATPDRSFPLLSPEPRSLTADPLPIEDLDAEPAFHIYLLGHDSVADHTVTFTADGDGGHRIDWQGAIALTYGGDETFRYGFRAEIRGARLTHIASPDATAAPEARRQVAHLLAVPEKVAESLLTVA
ncbi:hypothetical protein [Actinoplanes subglobosus]|uniref:Uncharacterized protein n=1 Tax=Actinoplanes subglobosus TaxID=1547892 RepID=A0ABV8IKE3_9ACTN